MTTRVSPVRAFTLIELLLVMVILVILASLTITMFPGQTKEAKIAGAKTSISNMETALSVFEVHCGRYPTNEEGLTVLVTNPGIEGWRGPYLKLVSPDPWGNPFVYQAPGTYLPDSFDLYSLGPDKVAGNQDDVVNWRSG